MERRPRGLPIAVAIRRRDTGPIAGPVGAAAGRIERAMGEATRQVAGFDHRTGGGCIGEPATRGFRRTPRSLSLDARRNDDRLPAGSRSTRPTPGRRYRLLRTGNGDRARQTLPRLRVAIDASRVRDVIDRNDRSDGGEGILALPSVDR